MLRDKNISHGSQPVKNKITKIYWKSEVQMIHNIHVRLDDKLGFMTLFIDKYMMYKDMW